MNLRFWQVVAKSVAFKLFKYTILCPEMPVTRVKISWNTQKFPGKTYFPILLYRAKFPEIKKFLAKFPEIQKFPENWHLWLSKQYLYECTKFVWPAFFWCTCRFETCAILRHVSDWHCVLFWKMCYSETFLIGTVQTWSYQSCMLNAKSWSISCAKKSKVRPTYCICLFIFQWWM